MSEKRTYRLDYDRGKSYVIHMGSEDLAREDAANFLKSKGEPSGILYLCEKDGEPEKKLGTVSATLS